jgi:GPH family glycoside/pentoside/hexuronide:cation symporter
MTDSQNEPQQLSRYQQLGWASGSLGTAIMLGALTSYAMFYMTNYLGLSALLAGGLIGLSKFYDLITDPLIAQLSDRTRSSWGRRRPYLLIGAVGCPLALALLFFVPDFNNELLIFGWLAIVLLLYATGFTFFNVPYLAMAAEMTSSGKERTLIMTQRIFFSTLGILAISAIGPMLIKNFGGGADGYVAMSWVLAVVVFVAMLATFVATRDTKTIDPSSRDSYGLIRQLRLLVANRPFRFYVLAKIFMFLSQSSVQVSMLYFAYYLLASDVSILQAFGIGYTVGSLLTLPIWNILISRYIGKRNAFMISALGLGLVFMTWLLAGVGEPTSLLYVRFTLLGVFSAGSQVAASAMLPDIMEYDRKHTGVNQEGLYAAAFSMVEKIANTLGPIVLGVLLGMTGYIASKGDELPQQPESAITAIQMMVSVIPFLLTVAAAWSISKYTLTDTKDAPEQTS